MSEIWFASTDEEHWDGAEEYATREEAIAEAPAYFGMDENTRFWVGRKVDVDYHSDWASRLIDDMAENACDEAGDAADGWLTSKATKAQRDELTLAVKIAIDEWLKRHGHEPLFFALEKVSEHVYEPPEKPSP